MRQGRIIADHAFELVEIRFRAAHCLYEPKVHQGGTAECSTGAWVRATKEPPLKVLEPKLVGSGVLLLRFNLLGKKRCVRRDAPHLAALI